MAIFPFVSKLLLSGQLSFEPGKITVFGHRIMIFPADLILAVNRMCEKDAKFRKDLYDAMKKAVYDFAVDINRREHIKQRDMGAFLTNLTEMNGYGKIQIPRLDFKKKIAVFQMRGLPSEQLIGKVKRGTIDYYWAGMLAGGSCFVFDDEGIDCVETNCVINGAPYCEFVAGKKDALKKLKPRTS